MAGLLARLASAFAPPRIRAAVGTGLEAGRSQRRLAGFMPGHDHVNTLIAGTGATVLARARYLARNNGYGALAIERWGDYVAGTGITPSWSAIENEVTRAAIHDLWRRWTDEADAEGLTDFQGLQRRAARELKMAGEVFFRLRPRYLSDGLSVPLQLQMLPSEMLDASYSVSTAGGPIIRQGIEFDRIGRRIAYHFWRVHPADATTTEDRGTRVRIPASQVLHILDAVEGGQVRGLSAFTPAIVKLWTLDQYDDAELERKKTAALFGGFITSDSDEESTPLGEERNAAPDDDTGDVTLEPGVIQRLKSGDDVKFAEPADVGQNYEAFQYRTLLQICAALKMPYTLVTGDMRQANYSSERAARLAFKRAVESFQHGVLVFLMCRPVAMAWLDQAVLAGALDLPGYAENPLPYRDIEWIPPRWEWIDPETDVKATSAAIRSGLITLPQAIAEQGGNVDAHLKEIAKTNAALDRHGIVLDSDARRVGAAGTTPANAPPPKRDEKSRDAPNAPPQADPNGA